MNFSFWPFLWFGLPGRFLRIGGVRRLQSHAYGPKNLTTGSLPVLLHCGGRTWDGPPHPLYILKNLLAAENVSQLFRRSRYEMFDVIPVGPTSIECE